MNNDQRIRLETADGQIFIDQSVFRAGVDPEGKQTPVITTREGYVITADTQEVVREEVLKILDELDVDWNNAANLDGDSTNLRETAVLEKIEDIRNRYQSEPVRK